MRVQMVSAPAAFHHGRDRSLTEARPALSTPNRIVRCRGRLAAPNGMSPIALRRQVAIGVTVPEGSGVAAPDSETLAMMLSVEVGSPSRSKQFLAAPRSAATTGTSAPLGVLSLDDMLDGRWAVSPFSGEDRAGCCGGVDMAGEDTGAALEPWAFSPSAGAAAEWKMSPLSA